MSKDPLSGADKRPPGKVQDRAEQAGSGSAAREPQSGSRQDDRKFQEALANVKEALRKSRHS